VLGTWGSVWNFTVPDHEEEKPRGKHPIPLAEVCLIFRLNGEGVPELKGRYPESLRAEFRGVNLQSASSVSPLSSMFLSQWILVLLSSGYV